MTNTVHDPVCGMPVDPASGRSAGHQGRMFFFCSEYCRSYFLAHPDRYGGEPPAGGASEDPASRRVAYFSMEVGLDDRLPIYSGGLGHIPGWARDPFSLRHAIKIPKEEVWAAHVAAKERLVEEIRRRTDRTFARDIFTISFARRATAYKRADLIFSDAGRLFEIALQIGSLQLVFAGKAHPRDDPGKEIIRRIFHLSEKSRGELQIVYLEDYDLKLAGLLTSGVDLWLNTPQPPFEASGTSGMKAAHNGVPSLSVLDGWWVEGHIEGVTGWSIGPPPTSGAPPANEVNTRDAAELYEKLSQTIIPFFYFNRDGWAEIMRRSIAFNASFFNTHRMVQQYASTAYL